MGILYPPIGGKIEELSTAISSKFMLETNPFANTDLVFANSLGIYIRSLVSLYIFLIRVLL